MANAGQREELQQLGIPVKTGVQATARSIRDFNPDFVVLATGAVPKPAPFDVSAISAAIPVYQAWEVLAHPDRVQARARVTIVGGGTVGLETADLLAARGCSVTLIEPKALLAEGISKSNRTEVIDRLRAAGVHMLVKTTITQAAGTTLELRGADGAMTTHEIGDSLVIAVGAQANLDMVSVLEESQVPYVAVGDCYNPGDFMTCLRDARMVGFAIDSYALRPVDLQRGPARLS